MFLYVEVFHLQRHVLLFRKITYSCKWGFIPLTNDNSNNNNNNNIIIIIIIIIVIIII